MLLGIDENAHKGSINNTIAVLAGGFNKILQGEKLILANKILENGGLLISEYPINMIVKSFQFLERNRIISGLSKAVVVVEAPYKSGAINTAKHALSQNKKLFAVPWNLNYSKGTGSNNLLLLGATPLIDYSQIINYLYPSPTQFLIDDFFRDTEIITTNNRIKNKTVPSELLGYYEFIKENAPVSIQELINFFNKSTIAEINSDISIMEIEGYIKQIDNSKYILA